MRKNSLLSHNSGTYTSPGTPDYQDGTCSSPRLRGMRKHSLLSRNSGTYTSPGTPDYQDGNVGGIHRGWTSERVPLPSNSSRRHISAAALLPFNSGRTLPSKWDDAERWITSPVSGFGVSKTLLSQPKRQPKSKSGPLGPPGVGCFPNYSATQPVLPGGSVLDFMVGFPITTGVLVPDGLSVHYGCDNGAQSNPVHNGIAVARSGSLPEWSDLFRESSLPMSQEEKLDVTKDAETMVSPVVLRRDMGTQMSPRNSTHSSPRGGASFYNSPSLVLPIVEPHSNQSAKLEIKDLQIDKRATITRHTDKHGMKRTKNRSPDVRSLTSPWDSAEAAKNMSKLYREEAKITAWENLQKAKAEAAIHKLEMKLEKKRSATMDKIVNKMTIAQMKAQEMRNSMSDSFTLPVPKTSHKFAPFCKYAKMGLLRVCFPCCGS